MDPKAVEFIHQSSYVFAGNNPVKYIDLNGVEQVSFDEMLTEIDSKVQEKPVLKVERELLRILWKGKFLK